MGTIGILCERVRVEEKQLIEALGLEGLPAVPVSPLDVPVAVRQPSEHQDLDESISQHMLLIDRCPDRSAGSSLVSVFGDLGLIVLGAGVASQGNRLDVARTLSSAGVARPDSYIAGSEQAGMAALRSTGYPATLMPLSFCREPLPVCDEDIAEAVLEHRHTLLSPAARMMIVQAGSPSMAELLDVTVVDGSAVATSTPAKPALRLPEVLRLAEKAANALGADIAGIRLAQTEAGVVVWDVHPVPEFRHLQPTGDASIATTIASLVKNRLLKGASDIAKRDGANISNRLEGIPEAARDAVLAV